MGTTNVAAVESTLLARDTVLRLLRKNLVAAQARMKQQADKHRIERTFNVDDWVYLRLQPYRQTTAAVRTSLKLSPRFFGPYKILQKIGSVAYKLDLPTCVKIHPVFHVSSLKRKVGTQDITSVTLPNVTDTGVLQAILDRRFRTKGNQAVTEVLVQWADASPDDATWEEYYPLLERFPGFDP